MHFLNTRQFSQAADAAVYTARNTPATATASVLLSIAKLSSLVCEGDDDETVAPTEMFLRTPLEKQSARSSSGVYASTVSVFAEAALAHAPPNAMGLVTPAASRHSDAFSEACRGLALLQSQDILADKLKENARYMLFYWQPVS
jgi:hypothetical protein